MGLSRDSKVGKEVGGKDSTVVVERNVTDIKIKNSRHVQAGVGPNEGLKKGYFSVSFRFCTCSISRSQYL